MSVDFGTDLELLGALDFDTPCDTFSYVTDSYCPNPARWKIWRSCCLGSPALLCPPCKDQTMTTEEGTKCRFCETVHTPQRLFASHIEAIDNRKAA